MKKENKEKAIRLLELKSKLQMIFFEHNIQYATTDEIFSSFAKLNNELATEIDNLLK